MRFSSRTAANSILVIASALNKENIANQKTQEEVTRMGLMIESLYTSLSQHSRDDYNVSSLSLCGDNRWA